MRSRFGILGFLLLSACASGQLAELTPEENKWPTDPALRLIAEDYFQQASTEPYQNLPPGLGFSFRNFDDSLISDHFVQRLRGMSRNELVRFVKSNGVNNFYDTERIRICNNPEARFLLDNGYRYAFNLKILGPSKIFETRKEFSKGFCIAGEHALIDSEAVAERYNMARFWPSGQKVDIRIMEKVTGLFQVIAAKFDEETAPDGSYFVTDVQADGLMLTFLLERKGNKTETLSKYWKQNLKGRSIENICSKPSRLVALTVGAVYAYSIKSDSSDGSENTSNFTVSYDDCLRYNRK
ncbi:MAG: hypothetical protein NXI13_00570 [Proteobacteria bacterium]|nr:hypothetical protein [Pseudomonadota bacterium]